MNPLAHTARVLVAEDEPKIRQYVSDIVAAVPGLELVCVASGEAAIAQLGADHWDVVITDQRMGATDGLEVLKHAAARQPHAQRAMMTGFAEVGLIAAAKNEGRVHRFLAKPFTPREFRAAIEELIADARATTQRAAAFERAKAVALSTQG